MNLRLKRTPGIFLVGFMGCGKSTVGRRLAEELGWGFVDLDADVEAAAGCTIPEIFEREGEASFRGRETAALKERVRQVWAARPLVIALGGGAFAQPGNRELLEGCGVTVWLDTPLARIEARIASQSHRPLARDPEQFRELYRSRRDAYSRADYTVEFDSDLPEEAVAKIRTLLGLL